MIFLNLCQTNTSKQKNSIVNYKQYVLVGHRLEIKKQRLKNKILGGAGLVAIGGVILILK